MWYKKYIGTYKNLIPCFQFLGTKELAQALREKKQPVVILKLVLLQHILKFSLLYSLLEVLQRFMTIVLLFQSRVKDHSH